MEFIHERLKQYTYVKDIGEGGYGKVVKVHDESGRRFFALKLLKKNEHLSSFEKEVKTLKKLHHPNIVSIYDASFTEKDGEIFILQEYMKHGNFIDYVQRRKEISIYEKLLLVQDITHALQHSHKQNYLHRDIKPQNMFVTNGDIGIYACLGDFGIAKKVEKDTVTETPGGVGTRSYLPPEVILGKGNHSKESDMYGLGVSMYELVTGRYPYQQTDGKSILCQILDETAPERPSGYNKMLSENIDRLCLKAIAKTREDRYKSIKVFLEDLNVCINEYKDDKVIRIHTETKEIIRVQDVNKPDQLLAKTDLQQDTQEMIRLGKMYLTGDGEVKQDTSKAIYYYRMAIEHNDFHGFVEMGDIYLYGVSDIGKDYCKAEKYYEMGMKYDKEGNSAYKLGLIYWFTEMFYDDEERAMKYFDHAVELGHKDAMFQMGEIYEKSSESENLQLAFDLYKKASMLGHVKALYKLGKFFKEGIRGYLDSDYEQAMYYAHWAAEKGESSGLVLVGDLYFEGKGVFYNYTTAKEYYEKAALLQDVIAMRKLGEMYFFGYAIEQDHDKAKEWYRQAANLGDDESMFRLGLNWHYGHGVEVDLKKAEKWYKKAIGEGNTAARLELENLEEKTIGIVGMRCDKVYNRARICVCTDENKERYKQAISDYEVAAIARDSSAMVALADLLRGEILEMSGLKGIPSEDYSQYFFGAYYCCGEKDFFQAREWYSRALEAGNLLAMAGLGSLFHYGLGVPKDYSKALQYYEYGVSVSDSKAMLGIGLLYEEGLGVQQDSDEAIKWYQKSADMGNFYAMLGVRRIRSGNIIHWDFEGKNFLRAEMWYQKGMLSESQVAQYVMNEVFTKSYSLWEKSRDYIDLNIDLQKSYQNKRYGSDTRIQRGDYYYSMCISDEYGDAKEVYEQQACKGIIQGINRLGVMYFFGDGVDQNFEEAKKYYLKAAQFESDDAMYNLGIIHEYGYDHGKSYVEAKKWYEESAAYGNYEAMFHLGLLYYRGYGVEADEKKAIEWYKKGIKTKQARDNYVMKRGYEYDAAMGNSQMFTTAGDKYYNQTFLLYKSSSESKRLERAKKYYLKGAALGNSDAMLQLGFLCLEEHNANNSGAKKWFARSADLGNTYAMIQMGKQCVFEKKYMNAKRWYLRAIVFGNQSAQVELNKLNIA